MGKYMKKSKIAGDVAVMEVSSPQSSLGVRTRAKTLALQNSSTPDSSSFAYLQLRSRRLLKVFVDAGKKQRPPLPEHPKKTCRGSPKTEFCGAAAVNSRLIDGKEENISREIAKGSEAEENFDVGTEGSFGENIFEVEGRDMSTRESTPCSFIRDSNTIDTPDSTTRQRTSPFPNQIIHEHMPRNIPTSYEMEEFFTYAEKQQQTMFMDKYNFDIVNDVPLPGRYEWVQVLH